MTTAICEHEIDQQQDMEPKLFVVWIDTNHGYSETDWEMNTPPQSLQGALKEAVLTRNAGFPTKVMIEGQTPRPDGLFSNPLTDH